MDIDVLTGWSREIQAPVDPEGSMRPTYRQADLLGLSELVLTECVCVWVTQAEGMRNVVGGCPVVLSGEWRQRWWIQQVHAVTRVLWLYSLVGSAMQVSTSLSSAETMWVWLHKEIIETNRSAHQFMTSFFYPVSILLGTGMCMSFFIVSYYTKKHCKKL